MTQSCRDPDWQDKDLVFTQINGKPYGPRQIQKAYKRILSAAGLPNIPSMAIAPELHQK
jgi:hypothetical protein